MSTTTAALPATAGQHRAGAPRAPRGRAASTTTSTDSTTSTATAAGTTSGTTAGRVVTRFTQLVAALLMVAAALTFLVLAVGPHLLGYRTATMLTGSMAPVIVPGDVIVATQEPAADVQVGDVITYHIPVEDHRVETHRVIEVIHRDDGSTAVRTQGDANNGADPWTATLDGNHVWQVQTVVPYVGTVIRTLRTPLIHHTLLYGIPALLVAWMLSSIWRRQN